jgi:hypothetical protein
MEEMKVPPFRHGEPVSAQTGVRRTGGYKFEPTDEQRRFVGVMAAGRLTYDEIASVIVNPKTKKSIDRNTLTKAFAEELRTGRAKLKSLALSKLYERVLHSDQWALAFVLRHVNGFTESNINIAIGDHPNAEDTGIELHFVLPNRVRKLAEEQDRQAKVTKVIEGFPEPMLKPL